jgi:hypothetical protein
VARRILADQLREILDELSPKEREILKLRHGLEDGIYHTLEEVGKKFGVTRERIRQIEAKALERIRTHDKAKRLRSYYTGATRRSWLFCATRWRGTSATSSRSMTRRQAPRRW